MPPYHLATLESYLSRKFIVKTEDLEIKMWKYNSDRAEKDCLSLFSIKAVLKHCFKKEDRAILDASKKILKLVHINSPSVVFYIQYPNEFLVALPLAKILKNNNKTIIFIGEFFVPIHEKIIKTYNFIDYIIYGSIAYSLKLLLFGVKENIPNMSWKGKDLTSNVTFQHKRDFFKKLPAPCFDSLPLKTYKAYLKTYFGIDKLVLSYKLSQGCDNKCFFCDISKYDSFNFKDTASVLTDLVKLSYRYKSKFFYFWDNSFTISNKYTKELCKKIMSEELNIEFIGMSHFEYLDEEAIQLLKDAGCRGLSFGIESVTLKGSYFLEKNRNLKKLPHILELCKKNGIWIHLFFMSGFPFQSLSNISKDLDFIKYNREYIDSIRINDFQLRINSNIYNYPEKYRIKSINYNLLPYKRDVPYSSKNENHKLYIHIFKELFMKLKINNLDSSCLSFLFNPTLKKAIINNTDNFLSSNTEIFLEKCKAYLERNKNNLSPA